MANLQADTAVSHGQLPSSDNQNLFDHSPDVICIINAQGLFTSVTAASLRIWGYPPAELIGRKYIDFVLAEDRQKTESIATAVMAGMTVTSFENRYLRKDGSVVPILWSAKWDHAGALMYCIAKDVSEKNKAERLQKLYEQRLLRAYKLGGIGWWEWDAVKDVHTVADELYKIYGLTKNIDADINPDVYLSLVHPDDLAVVKDEIISLRQKKYGQYEHRMIKPSGEVIFVIHYVESVTDENGNLLQVHGITKDITQRKTAVFLLKESEQKLATILESIDDCFFAVDKSWTVTYWNRKAEKLLQKKKEDMIGKNIWDEFPLAFTSAFYDQYQKACTENTAVQFEEYYAPGNMWIEASAYPSSEGLAVYFKDTTERKNAQEELRKINQRYEMVSRATSDAIWDWDLQTDIIYWGEGFQSIFGHRLKDLVSDIRFWSAQVHPEDAAAATESLQAAIRSDATNWTAEYRFLKADGTYAVVLDKGFVIRDEEGKAIRMAGAMQDITKQKEAEVALKLSENYYRLLFYQSPKPKLIFSEETFQIVDVNEAAIELYGYSKEEFLTLKLPDLKLECDIPLLATLRKQQLTHYQDIVRHKKKNGDVFTLELSSHVIYLQGGRHFIATGDDITEKIQLQQTIVEEKVAAQKEVAKAIIDTQERERSEIAKELHDNINQLLTTAKLYVENINYYPEQKSLFIEKGVSLLQKSIDEIRTLSKQLVTPVINDIGFKATIDELLMHFSSLNTFGINLAYEIEEHLLDKTLQLTSYRIIQEQLNNIVKYAKASQVTIELTSVGTDLVISIKDNGIGFELEKTSKGQGLRNMKNRVEVYKGSISINTSPGNGTEVKIIFPNSFK